VSSRGDVAAPLANTTVVFTWLSPTGTDAAAAAAVLARRRRKASGMEAVERGICRLPQCERRCAVVPVWVNELWCVVAG
jgi:hypothetical protein